MIFTDEHHPEPGAAIARLPGTGWFRPAAKQRRPHPAVAGSRQRHLALAISGALALCAAQVAPAQFPAVVQLSALNGSNGFVLDGVAAGDGSGFAVGAAGDVNDDGFDDILIGAFGADLDQFTQSSGSSYVVFGRGTGFPAAIALANLDGTNGFRLDGVAAGDYSGRSVSGAGDVNGDGIGDLLIGAYRAGPNQMTRAGSSYLVFGRSTGFPAALPLSNLDGSNGFRLDGVAANDFSGRAVSAAGDINGDGIDDLLVGAFGADPNGDNSGSSYVVFGGISGLGEVPVIGLTPDPLDFGDVAFGMAMQTLVVENTGTGTLQPGTVSISGTHAADFSIEMSSCIGAQLTNGQFCSIEIGFSPSAPGIRQATLVLESNALTSPNPWV